VGTTPPPGFPLYNNNMINSEQSDSSHGIEFVEKNRQKYITETAPTIEDIHTLALRTQEKMNEYGVSVYTTSEGNVGSVYTIGREHNIFEPAPSELLRGNIKSGVFIHCHPLASRIRVDSGTSLDSLPSRMDFKADLWSRVIGGYMNVASESGFTMCIGIEGISREDYVTRRLRRKVGAHDLAGQQVWKILSGNNAGTAFADKEVEEAIMDRFPLEKDMTLVSNTGDLGTRYFLHLPWDKLEELKGVYGSFENLCFGDGLDRLTEHLDIDVPHSRNLGDTAISSGVRPKKR
jgi:hypothetical protein